MSSHFQFNQCYDVVRYTAALVSKRGKIYNGDYSAERAGAGSDAKVLMWGIAIEKETKFFLFFFPPTAHISRPCHSCSSLKINYCMLIFYIVFILIKSLTLKAFVIVY